MVIEYQNQRVSTTDKNAEFQVFVDKKGSTEDDKMTITYDTYMEYCKIYSTHRSRINKLKNIAKRARQEKARKEEEKLKSQSATNFDDINHFIKQYGSNGKDDDGRLFLDIAFEFVEMDGHIKIMRHTSTGDLIRVAPPKKGKGFDTGVVWKKIRAYAIKGCARSQ